MEKVLKVQTYYAGVCPTWVKIATEKCDLCGSRPTWPHALICYDAKERKKFETSVAGRVASFLKPA